MVANTVWYATMNEHFVVTGGNKLNGTVRPAGNKNAALPLIAATLMAEGPSTIRNVPKIKDVEALLELVSAAGADVSWTGPNELQIDPRGLEARPLDAKLCARIRASILLVAPLLSRFGKVTLPPPGGDVIGRRRVDTHFLALEGLGAEVSVGAVYQVECKELVGTDLFLDEPSVTGTENALMAAVMARGKTIMRNAASEPHVQDLAHALIKMGAHIEGIGTNRLTINGVSELHGAQIDVGPDHIEIGSFIGLAAVTDSEIRIEGVRPEDLTNIVLNFAKLGIDVVLEDDAAIVKAHQERRIRSDFGGHIPQVEDGPWPAFPADLTSIATVVATQCEGMVMIFEKMFESRLFFVDKLIAMGAQIVLCDPHRAVVYGPTVLRGGEVESPDIRAGMAMLLAALAAEGTSRIYNIRQIDRGYERIDERLRSLGADIERVS